MGLVRNLANRSEPLKISLLGNDYLARRHAGAQFAAIEVAVFARGTLKQFCRWGTVGVTLSGHQFGETFARSEQDTILSHLRDKLG